MNPVLYLAELFRETGLKGSKRVMPPYPIPFIECGAPRGTRTLIPLWDQYLKLVRMPISPRGPEKFKCLE